MHQYKILQSGVPLAQAKKALVLLHGRGGSAHDIMGLAPEFVDETFYVAAVQAENSTWYPYSFMAPESSNEPWLSGAVKVAKQAIDEAAAQLGMQNVYLMGFSQGACLTLEVATRYAQKMGGVVAFTGGLIGQELNKAHYQGNFASTKVYIANSNNDPHVPLSRSEESKQIMENLGAEVQLSIFPNRPHSISGQEIEQVRKLLF